MPNFGRQGPPGPDFGREPSIDAVRRADSFLDALAGGRPVAPQDPADAELAALLGGWRDELRWPPATGLIAESDAVAALNAGLAQKRPPADPQRWTDTQKRHRRGLSLVGTAAAAMLCIGGFGALVAGAGPNDALYGVRTMIFGAPKQIRDDQVGLAARTELNQVQDLIDAGDWDQAQNKLVAVSTQVATIDDEEQKQDLLNQFNELSAKVVERDPEATAPPGVVYTVPPSSSALVPAVAPTSTPSAPAATSTSEPASVSTSPVSTSASEAPATTVTTPATSTVPQSQPTTTPTSAAPTSSAALTPVTTSAAPATTPAPAAQTTVPVTTAPVTTTVEAPPAPSAAPETAAQVAPEPASAAAPTTEQAVPSVPSVVITTTMVAPVLEPVG